MPAKKAPTLAAAGKATGLAVAASFVIHDAANMTPEGRKAIADWLRQHAKDLVKLGTNYSKRFTGRYWYKPAAAKPKAKAPRRKGA